MVRGEFKKTKKYYTHRMQIRNFVMAQRQRSQRLSDRRQRQSVFRVELEITVAGGPLAGMIRFQILI